MDWFEHIIVGSGPAGVAAARQLQGRGTCLIDVGSLPATEFPYASLQQALSNGDVESLLGKDWQMLANVVEPQALHPKMRAAGLRFVLDGSGFSVQSPAGERLTEGRGSHAQGGMSNAWGAQLLRYTERDLAEVGGWPITAADLSPFYQDLESHIVMSGALDDLSEFLGPASLLQPPVPCGPAGQHLLRRYQSRRSRVRARGLTLGRPRLAIATQACAGSPAYTFGETEFFAPARPGLYSARATLSALLAAKACQYLPGLELRAFHEHDDHVLLECLARDGSPRQLRGRHVLLACGTLQTARLVLAQREAWGQRLPFIDHPPTLLPLFIPAQFGAPMLASSYAIHLIGCLQTAGHSSMVSFYHPGGLLRTDLLPDVPLPMPQAGQLLQALLPGMLVAQIWQPALPGPDRAVWLDPDGTLRIQHQTGHDFAHIPPLIRALRPLGAYSMTRLASGVAPGWGFHHAGCLPMRTSPGPFETHCDGRLWDSRRVRVIDGACLPALPAKNHSLTLMANASRIAKSVRSCES